jgi:hypothetical protein
VTEKVKKTIYECVPVQEKVKVTKCIAVPEERVENRTTYVVEKVPVTTMVKERFCVQVPYQYCVKVPVCHAAPTCCGGCGSVGGYYYGGCPTCH